MGFRVAANLVQNRGDLPPFSCCHQSILFVEFSMMDILMVQFATFCHYLRKLSSRTLT